MFLLIYYEFTVPNLVYYLADVYYLWGLDFVGH